MKHTWRAKNCNFEPDSKGEIGSTTIHNPVLNGTNRDAQYEDKCKRSPQFLKVHFCAIRSELSNFRKNSRRFIPQSGVVEFSGCVYMLQHSCGKQARHTPCAHPGVGAEGCRLRCALTGKRDDGAPLALWKSEGSGPGWEVGTVVRMWPARLRTAGTAEARDGGRHTLAPPRSFNLKKSDCA